MKRGKHIIECLYPPKAISMEDACKLIILSFAGFCKCLAKNIYEVDYIKYKVKDKVNSIDINKSFELIFTYSNIKDDFVKHFLEKISIDDMTQEIWRDIIEFLIHDILIYRNFRELETPEFIDRLNLAILSPKEGTFYDGSAGMGSTIVSAIKYENHLEIYAQEINALFHAIMTLRLYVHNVSCKNICCGDTLTEPLFVKANQLQAFDYSIMYPPIGNVRKDYEDIIANDRYGRFNHIRYSSSSSEWLFVMHQYASLNDGGKGITVLPSGFFFNEAVREVRRILIEEGAVECVISLPSNMISYTKVPLYLLVMSKARKENVNSNILFIRADELFEQYKTDYKKGSDAILNQIIDIYRNKKEQACISKMIPSSKLENQILLPSRYIQKTIKVNKIGNVSVREPRGDSWIPLREAGTLYRGINVSVSSKGAHLSEQKIINYTDVQDGELCLKDIQTRRISYNTRFEKSMVQEGDLLISCKGTSIKICVVPKHDEELILSANFIGIHIDSSKYDPYFIKYYLESPAGQSFLLRRQVGTSIFTLAVRDLEEIPVPLLSRENQKNYLDELIYKEKIIYEQIENLYTQSAKAKWDFYMKIGLGKIMMKEDD